MGLRQTWEPLQRAAENLERFIPLTKLQIGAAKTSVVNKLRCILIQRAPLNFECRLGAAILSKGFAEHEVYFWKVWPQLDCAVPVFRRRFVLVA